MKKHLFISLLVVLLGFIFCLNGCSSELPEKFLSKRALCLKPNDEFILKANLGERAYNAKNIYWASTDPTVVSLSTPSNNSVTIKALSLGQCNVTLFVDSRPISSCRIIVDDDGTVKILAIGNSFSEDALEQHLYDIVNAEGINIVIGNMYIGGCSIERHWQNASTDAAEYNYRKIVEGKKKATDKIKISQAIADENWDYISFQQASHFSGIFSTYEKDLPSLVKYVKDENKKSGTQYVLHQTWAYSNNSTHDGFRNYNNNQITMYKEIVSAISKASCLTGIGTIIPVGTAIQNGRTSFVGDHFCRDGYHLDYQIGRYTASCTWAEKLLGLNILTNPYMPIQLTLDEILIARISAHYAINQPNEVSCLKGW